MKTLLRGFTVSLFLLALTSCRSNPSFNFGAYSEAEKFYEKREYGKAIAKYEAYVRENPEGNLAVISYYYMAKSYEGVGNVDKAKELYEKITQEHPRLVWANFARARLQELRGEAAPGPQTPS